LAFPVAFAVVSAVVSPVAFAVAFAVVSPLVFEANLHCRTAVAAADQTVCICLYPKRTVPVNPHTVGYRFHTAGHK
jgi:hypothetical protein